MVKTPFWICGEPASCFTIIKYSYGYLKYVYKVIHNCLSVIAFEQLLTCSVYQIPGCKEKDISNHPPGKFSQEYEGL
jgi:hypothetical protein